MSQKPKTKKRDPLQRMKFVAYSMANLPDGMINIDDYIRFAKLQLCVKTRRLLKDPIWDSYTAEELLTEFFAHEFLVNKKFTEEFEMQLGSIDGALDSFDAWANRQIKKNQKERVKIMGEMEEKISFDPSKDVMGE